MDILRSFVDDAAVVARTFSHYSYNRRRCMMYRYGELEAIQKKVERSFV